MEKIIKKIILIFILISAFYITKVYAAGSFSLSASKTTINKGESVTITIKANNAYGQVEISATNATVSSSSEFLQNDTKQITVTSNSDNDIKVTVAPGKGGVGDIEENPITSSQSITIKVNKPNTGGNNNTGNNSSTGTGSNSGSNSNSANNTSSEKSKEARLSNLGIKPNDFSGFKRDKTEYSVEVPNNVAEVNVYATPVNQKAKVAGTGKVSLKEGDNTVKITVTAEAGNTKTYTLNIKRKAATEDAATNTTITPEEPDTTSAEKEKDAVTSTTENEFGLSSLQIANVKINPEFKTNTYEYKIETNQDINSLDIQAVATDENAKVEILKNENEEQDENIITILVTNEETGETATYQIIVNKAMAEETVQMSWLKPSTWGKEEYIKIAIITVLIILIIIAIILKIKLSKEKKNENDLDLPGADELDKALAEHQELTENQDFGDLSEFANNQELNEQLETSNNSEFVAESEFTESQEFDRQPEIEEDYESYNNQKYNSGFSANYLEDIARSKNYDIDYQDDYQEKPRRKKGKHF